MLEKIRESRILTEKGALYKEIGLFTLPCMLELMLFSMISVVNLAMVGRLGALALTAVGLSTQPVNISLAAFQAFNVGATALIARFTGAGNIHNARKVMVQSLQVSILLALAVSVPLYVFARQVVEFMGAQPEAAPLAATYMRFMAAGTVFQAVPLTVSSLLRGAGDSKTPMKINVLANIINVVLGYLFIYGPGIFPAWGVFGAGVAATGAKVVSSVLAVTLLFTTRLPVRLDRSVRPGLDGEMILRIVRIGSASALEQIILRVGFFIYTRSIAGLGTLAFAAHHICLNISGLSTNLGQALGMASTSFTGRSLGAGKPSKAMEYVKELELTALILSLGVSLAFVLFGRNIAMIYTDDPGVLKALIPVLAVLAVINPAQNTLLVLSGSLKGAGDTKWPLLTSLLGLSVIRIPLVLLLLKYTDLGLKGAWIAAAAEKYLSYLLFRFRYDRGGWKTLAI